VKDAMLHYFKDENFSEGIIKGVGMTGEHLKRFFPHKKNDINELSDDISFGNK
jgi:uncharacterized membrane protein